LWVIEPKRLKTIDIEFQFGFVCVVFFSCIFFFFTIIE
jgi:hypothetical protein